MKKALIVSTVSRQFYLFEQVNIKVLRELGYEVHGAANFSDRSERLEEINIIEHQIDFQRFPFSFKNLKAYFQLKKEIKDNDFEIIHSHSPVGGVIGRLAGYFSKKNSEIIYTAHGFHFFKGSSIVNWFLYFPIEFFLSFITDKLIVINNEDFKFAKKYLKMKNLILVNGVGVNYNKFKKIDLINKINKRVDYGFDENQFILIYVGELSKRKNQSVLVDVMKSIVKYKSDVILLLVGTGNEKNSLIKNIENNDLKKNIKLLGYRNDVADLMQISDLAVSSSKQEGLPVNLMEAMGVGLPLVVSNCRGNRDLVSNESNGFIIFGDDQVDTFTKKILYLIENELVRDSFSNKSFELSRNYSEDNIKNVMRSVYN